MPGDNAGEEAQLLSLMQHMQQLTHLGVDDSLCAAEGDPPAAAYAALTASSKLQQLNVSCCHLPTDVWQHMLPVGRQLPFLQHLDVSKVKQPGGAWATPPEGTCLVSCCPGLQSLELSFLRCSAEMLLSLQGLSGLHILALAASDPVAAEAFHAVCQLAGLKGFRVRIPGKERGALALQLTQLKQLTSLQYCCSHLFGLKPLRLTCEVSFYPVNSFPCLLCLQFCAPTCCNRLSRQHHQS